MQTINKFVRFCHQQVQAKIHKLQIDSEKHKKIVEQSVVIATIHQWMDQGNNDYFKHCFIHRNLYLVFVRQNLSGFRSAQEFEKSFSEIFKVEQSINRLNPEFRRKLDIEQQKFCGKIAVGDHETASEITTGTKLTKKSAGSKSPSKVGGNNDDLDEAATLKEDPNYLRGNPDFDPNPDGTQAQMLEDEVAQEEEKLMEEEKKKAKDTKDVQNMLDDVMLDEPAEKKQPQETSSQASSE